MSDAGLILVVMGVGFFAQSLMLLILYTRTLKVYLLVCDIRLEQLDREQKAVTALNTLMKKPIEDNL